MFPIETKASESEMFKTIQLTTSPVKGVSILTFNRPSKRNAINVLMYNEIQEALRQAGRDESVAGLVLTGAGEYYSSGNDLSNFSAMKHPKTMSHEARLLCESFVNAFVDFPKPLYAAVNGPAIGIPVTTMGLCDSRLSVPDATFQTPFKQLAQAPEGCSSYMFPRLMGKEWSHKVLEEGVKFTAAEGKQFGFLQELVPKEKLMETATLRVREQVDKKVPRFTLAEKGLIEKLKEVNRQEVTVLEKAWISKECFDALDAYLTSRKATGPALVIRTLNKTRFLWDR